MSKGIYARFKNRITLSQKVGAIIFSIYFALTILITFFVYNTNEIQIKETFTSSGMAVAQMISSIIPAETLSEYQKEAIEIVSSGAPAIAPDNMPQNYQKFRSVTADFVQKLQVTRICISTISNGKIIFLIDSMVENPRFFAESIPYDPDTYSIDYVKELGALKNVAQSINISPNPNLFSVMKPIVGENGKPICHIRVDVDLSAPRTENLNDTLFSIFVDLLIAIIFSILTYLYFGVKMIRPIKRLSTAAIQFNMQEHTNPLLADSFHEPIAYESVFDKLQISSFEEIAELHNCLKNMEIDIHQQISELLSMNKERESVQEALKIASTIQTSLLPSATKSHFEQDTFTIYPILHSSTMVSGNFYDFYRIDNHRLCITIGDISSTGLPAALLMVRIRTLLRDHSTPNVTPAEMISHVNHQLCIESIDSLFASIWVGILDTQTGDIVFANAGHQYPIIGRNGEYHYLKKNRNNLVVGVFSDQIYENHTFRLDPGCDLILYSDGVIFSTNREMEFFGRKRPLTVLHACCHLTIEQAITSLYQNILTFTDNSLQYEDVVLIGLRYFGSNHYEEKGYEKIF